MGIQENKIIMEKFKEYTREKWEELGLLEQLPEDRKEMTVFCYNIVIKPDYRGHRAGVSF